LALGDGRGRQHDVRAERPQEEIRSLVDLALDQRRGAGGIAGVIEQLEVDLVLVAGDLHPAQHVVHVADGGDVSVVDVEAGLGGCTGKRNRPADHQGLGLGVGRAEGRRGEHRCAEADHYATTSCLFAVQRHRQSPSSFIQPRDRA
jgi:hypothetical protein